MHAQPGSAPPGLLGRAALAREHLLGPVLLGAVLALLVGGGLGHAGRRSVDRDLASGRFQLTPRAAVRAVRAYLTNEDDMYRCHAYAQAMLGRPYRSYFVRPRSGWDAAFARGLDEDPDATPLVTPSAPLRPYRDFFVEYPPGFLLVALPPALMGRTADGYAFAFKLQMGLCLVACLLGVRRLLGGLGLEPAVERTARRWLVGAFAAALLALGVVSTHRYDAFVAMLVVLALEAAARGQGGRAGLWLGAAIASKGIPVLLVPLVAVYLRGLGQGPAPSRRFVAAVAAVAGGAMALARVWFGPGIFEAFAYHAARPIQIESTWGAALSLVGWLRPGTITVVHSFSSRNLRGGPVAAAGVASSAVLLIALGAVTAVSLHRLWPAEIERARRLRLLLEGSVVLLIATMTLGKVFCPQYLVWVLPLGLLVSAPGCGHSRWRATIGLLLLGATQVIYPLAYPAVKTLAPWATTLVLVRDLALLGWAATLLGVGGAPKRRGDEWVDAGMTA